MRIDRIDVYHVAMPLIEPWRTAYGEDATVESILCRMSSGSVDAWGESSPLAAPCYSPEWAGGVFASVRNWLAPRIIGQEIDSGESLQALLAPFKGNPFAKAALDNAWWALRSRIENRSIAELLGATRQLVPVGADFGVSDDFDALCQNVSDAVEDGYPRVKLKFRPGWDLPMLQAVRERCPDAALHIDCNSGYRFSDLPLFRDIDRFHLEMIEQPLAHDDIIDHAALQREIRTPICLDESIASLHRAEQAIAQNACQYINIKPGRVGGLTIAKQIHDLCADANIPCWVGGMLESATGASLCASLAMLDNFTYPADIFPSARFYVQDLSDDPIELVRDENNTPSVASPVAPAEPNLERLAACTQQHATFTR